MSEPERQSESSHKEENIYHNSMSTMKARLDAHGNIVSYEITVKDFSAEIAGDILKTMITYAKKEISKNKDVSNSQPSNEVFE